MPSWKKLIISGSDAAVPSVSTTGDFTIDASGDIVLDADGADIVLKDGGAHFGSIKRVTSDLVIKAETSNKHMLLKGNDGGSTITALDLDMENAGNATFNNDVTTGGVLTISDSTPTLNFYDTDDTAIRGFIQWDGTAGVIDSDSTLTLRANNTAGARIQLTNANGITQFYNGSTAYAQLDGGGTDLELKSLVSNASFTLRGNDGGSEIDMLAFDVAGGGDARFRQDVIAYYSSDKRLKDNIVRIENPLEKIDKIGGYTFDWNDKQETYTGKDVGVIAQEIQEVLPELVTERDNGYLAVKYEKIVPLLIESIKELKQEVDDIKQKCDCLNK